MAKKADFPDLKKPEAAKKNRLMAIVMPLVAIAAIVLIVLIASSPVTEPGAKLGDIEVQSIAKQIDDVISYKGASNSATIALKPSLRVGGVAAPYMLEILGAGTVRLTLYSKGSQTVSESRFGVNLSRTGGDEKISCSQEQIRAGASIEVRKTTQIEYSEGAMYRVDTVTISGCGNSMVLEGRYQED